MEYFIGLTFDPSSIHHNKIESFRKRFDSKYSKGTQLQMTLLPPFTVDFHCNNEAQEFVEDLSDILDGHLHGIDEISQIEFNGITFTMGKKGLLALTPILSPDLLHCQESLYSCLKDNGAKFKKSKGAYNPILPIGRFDYMENLESGIEVAKVEFSNPFVLDALSFALFEKTPQEWKLKNDLYDFGSRNHFFRE